MSAALSAVFIKYPATVQNELQNQIINFDLYYDVLQIETQNYLVFEKITFDYDTNTVQSASEIVTYIRKGTNDFIEKISNVWFNEDNSELVYAALTLYPTYSASNYKAVYPIIYSLKLDTLKVIQLYPSVNASTLTFSQLSAFSLSGTGYDINVVETGKPVLNYSPDTGKYNLSYVGKDPSNMFYTFNTIFNYINGTLSNVTGSVLVPTMNVFSANFGNPTFPTYLVDYTLQGSGQCYLSGNEFFFGVG